VPKLSHLSGGDWQKKKAHIKERVNELADRLIALYGQRAKQTGFAFPPDDELQKKFEDEFPYPLTPDQDRSLKEIKADMEKPEIMDRLLCGDVGFGKTEIAFRAAFKAISAGKQVAILCPTTFWPASITKSHSSVSLLLASTSPSSPVLSPNRFSGQSMKAVSEKAKSIW
jgi:transcription-repair coupling factor (superfamily II helicase)